MSINKTNPTQNFELR